MKRERPYDTTRTINGSFGKLIGLWSLKGSPSYFE